MMAYTSDAGRDPRVQPGHLVYSAQLDRNKLKCYYRCCELNCCPEVQATRTFLDVYQHGVMVNIPSSKCGCCCTKDEASMLFWSDQVFTRPAVKGGCCTPCPYLCPHACNCCGETLVMESSCGCPRMKFHWAAVMCGCCPIDVFTGLPPGEADNITAAINMAKANATSLGTARVPAFPPAQPMMMAPVATMPYGGPAPEEPSNKEV